MRFLRLVVNRLAVVPAVWVHGSARLTLSAAILCAVASLAQAQIDWNNTSNINSFYDISTNWDGNVTPGAADTARFDLNNTYQVWWDVLTPTNAPDVGMLQVADGNVTFRNLDLVVQHGLTINGSGGAGLLSDFSISGATTTLTNLGLHLHSLGGAEIIGGAALTIDGTPVTGSMLTVDGTVGFAIDGTLSILSGGTVSNTFNGFIGDQPGSTGTVTVDGNGSTWTNDGDLFVGWVGNGTLVIQNGGTVSNTLSRSGERRGAKVCRTVG
jgi:T5SS/PEP-CTERM-associated repeat protein